MSIFNFNGNSATFEMIKAPMFIAIIVAVFALVFAFILTNLVSKESEGTDKMKEISASIREGAKAFLFAEYRILAVVIVLLFIAIAIFTNQLLVSYWVHFSQ